MVKHSRVLVALSLAALCGVTSADMRAAFAAGFCADPVQGGNASGESKEAAEKAAISWWSSRAGSVGRGYETWANAKDQKVDCKQATNGTFSCRASARPCLADGVVPENDPRIHL